MFLIFDDLHTDDQYMLPISLTAFKQKKTAEGRPYLIAYFDNQVFELKGSIAGINFELQSEMRRQLETPHGNLLLK